MTGVGAPDGGAELRVRRLASINEVPEDLWDGLRQGIPNPHNAHCLIRAVESAGIADSRLWVLLFYDRDRLVASAVLSAFTVSLDIFFTKRFKSAIALIRRIVPSFLRIDVLFCGLPVSFGQNNLTISECAPAQRVLELLNSEMESICREARMRFMCIKEFKEHELVKVEGLEQMKFFQGYSIPCMTLQVRWRTFDEYLGSLRHSYRRHIRRSLAKMGLSRPEVAPFSRASFDNPDPHLVLGGPEVMSPRAFFDLYLNVMARAAVKLEVLNEAFFEGLWRELGHCLQILAVIAGNRVLGAALLIKAETTLHFLLVGLPEEKKTPHDVYSNLLHAICHQAIQQGCHKINLGQTSYWQKQQIGGEPEEEFIFFKALNPRLNWILCTLRHVLFPRMRLDPIRAFK